MNTQLGAVVVVVVAVAALAGCGPTPQPAGHTQVATHVLVVPASGHVTGTYPTTCHRNPGDDPRLPVLACTPGSIRSDIDPTHLELTVCKPNWSATVRPPTTETNRSKTAAMASYGVPVSQRPVTELDHLVPLELGGGNSTTNLWPEVSDKPGRGFRNSKDAVEDEVHSWVCHGNQAQWSVAVSAFASNWTTAERSLGIKP